VEGTDQMPKHRVRNVKKWSELEKDMKIETVLIPKSEEHLVSVRLLIDSNVKVTGKYSGRNYLFSGAGSVQDVDQIDVEWLLERRQGGRQCCGGGATGNVVFELAGE